MWKNKKADEQKNSQSECQVISLRLTLPKVKGAIRARSALSAHFVKNRKQGSGKKKRKKIRKKEKLSNKEIESAERSFALVPVATPCIFDFLHATAQEMDSYIAAGRRRSATGEIKARRRNAEDLFKQKFGNLLLREKFARSFRESRDTIASKEI